jgi:hypothetical protein
MTIPAAQLIERKSEPRESTNFDLTPYLKKSFSDDVVRSALVDISIIGIEITSFDYLKPDSDVRIVCKSDEVRFRVAWSKADSTEKGLWQVGLLALNPNLNLKNWFEQQGLQVNPLQTKVNE